MGCFLSCFRGRPDPAAGLRDPLVPKTRLGDAFLDDHHGDGDGDEAAKLEAGEITKEGLGNDGGVDDDGLRREANYLKSCGAILETPPEMLKSSSLIKAEDINECNNTANNAQEIEGEIMVSENKDHLSEGFNHDGQGTLNHDQNAGEEDADTITEVESVPRSSSQERSSGQSITNQKLDPSDSPFPTPLILRGDVQTPGFTAAYQQGSFKPGKRGRASKQFVYPVLRPIENKLQWNELRDESSSPVVTSHPPKRRYLSAADSAEKPPQQQQTFSFNAGNREQLGEDVASPEEPRDENGDRQQQLLGGGGVGELLNKSSENGKHGVASLSSWLKTSSVDGEGQVGAIAGEVGKLPGLQGIDLSDLPIFVASGLSWDDNENNPTPMMPKAWDGNGIPNTTTKYKEDQRVSWHATPFEERLMKVLSDEKPHLQRKISGKLIHLEEEGNMTESPASATASS